MNFEPFLNLLKLNTKPPIQIEGDKCPVCLDDVTEEDIYKTICSHKFHKKCLIEWIKDNDTCPCCRKEIITPFNRKCCTTHIYTKPNKEMNTIKFLLYLIGACSYEEIDYCKMMENAKYGDVKNSTYLQLKRYLFFEKDLLSSEELIKMDKIIVNFYKYLDLTKISIGILLSLRSSNSFVSMWFYVLLFLYFAFYESNYKFFTFSKKFFYDEVKNPFYFILYCIIVSYNFFIYVIPSFIFLKNPLILDICRVDIIISSIKFCFIMLSLTGTLLKLFLNLRKRFKHIIKREFDDETNFFTSMENIRTQFPLFSQSIISNLSGETFIPSNLNGETFIPSNITPNNLRSTTMYDDVSNEQPIINTNIHSNITLNNLLSTVISGTISNEQPIVNNNTISSNGDNELTLSDDDSLSGVIVSNFNN
jgi:hypothetical protein